MALTVTSSANPVATPATSLLVYNTATVSDVTPGYYYWSGTAWVRFNTGAGGGGGWLLLGNSGTVDGTDFLGTIDNRPLNFRVFNTKAGRIETDNALGNVFLGYMAGNVSANNGINTAIGSTALKSTTTGTGNTAVGVQALVTNISGNNNVAVGFNALSSNQAGGENTAIGIDALFGNTATGNTAIGWRALSGNSTGYGNTAIGLSALNSVGQGCANTAIGSSALYKQSFAGFFWATNNVAVGYQALYSNQPTFDGNGNDNTAVGNSALYCNTTGYYNIAIGERALSGSDITDPTTTPITGNSNVAIGRWAMFQTTSGYSNTGVGLQALSSLTTGFRNTAVGQSALSSVQTGTNNTSIGYLANVDWNLSNSTAIGSGASVTVSNKVRIGNASVTVIEGQVDFTWPSDARFKENVKEDVKGIDFIMKLHPVSYNFNRLSFAKHIKENTEGREKELQQLSQIRSVGFLAQDIEKIVKETGFEAFDAVHVPANENDNYGLSYSHFVIPLVKAVQEQQEIVKDLKTSNNDLQSTIGKLQTEILTLKSLLLILQSDYDTRLKKRQEQLGNKAEK
ncbi:MAG: hypothetical protein EPN85_12840 [Bacteroidetes bacterium]|nr:MAG: hypothetical protein EPN85_12840 [Bacteroidota bacterium]